MREAERLREIAEVKPRLPLDTVVAQVVARGGRALVPHHHHRTAGERDGVAPQRARDQRHRRGGAGDRGWGPHAAKVQLLLDRESGLGVRIERSRITAVVSGQAGFADAVGSDLRA